MKLADLWQKLVALLQPQPLLDPRGQPPIGQVQGTVKEPMVLDYTPYIQDQNKVDQYFPKGIPQPPTDVLSRILEYSPNDATRSALIKLGEVGGFNTAPPDYTGNRNGTVDRGPNMINSGTFDWLLNQEGNKGGTYPYRQKLNQAGISGYGDMNNPDKNEFTMDLIRKILGYGAWYGPKDKGFDLLPEGY